MKKKKTRVLKDEEQERLRQIIQKAKAVNMENVGVTGDDRVNEPENGLPADLFADLFLYNDVCKN